MASMQLPSRNVIQERPHPKRMALSCIYDEIGELVQVFKNTGDDDLQDTIEDRWRQMHGVLERRLDIQYPECPDCEVKVHRDEFGGIVCPHACDVPEDVREEFKRQDGRLWGNRGHDGGGA